MTVFLAEFFDEASARLTSINQKLVLLEAAELDEAGLIQLRRDIHTIKGSAQMLGVQDISELCHVFEDAMDYAVLAGNPDVLPMIQFLFDLHDELLSRLSHRDATMRLDVGLKKVQFEALKKNLLAQTEPVKKEVPKAGKSSIETPAKRVRRKKKGKVAKSLIAAVMGSFETSLQQPAKATSNSTISQDMESTLKQPVETIDFRPNLTELDGVDEHLHSSSGNFLRVDRSRLSNLSNQIVELASLRFRNDAPEQQLQSVVRDFRALKDKLLADPKLEAMTRSSLQDAMDSHLRQIHQCSDALRQQQQRSSVMLDAVRDQVLQLMLKPLNTVFSIFPRAVRDVAKRNGKKVQLLVAGDAVEMDQLAAETLTEPLMHLINNAVAHGIEEPEQRSACGKPPEGQITICASQKGNLIHLDVSDDGKGMDVDEIRLKAIADGMISASEAEDMDNSEVLELIFHPGFSTQKQVTELAGRGMGMSVVLDVMRELTGNIHIHSKLGQGTRFSMIFPVSLTVQQAKFFRIGKQRFGMLSNLIAQVIPLQQQQIKTASGPFRKGYIHYQGHRVPIINLHDVLVGGATKPDDKSEHAKILVVEHLEGFLAMPVDEVLAKTEVMVRELDPYLKHYHPIGLMGCTIVDDGSVQLLLEPNGLKEMWRTAPDGEVVQELDSNSSHRPLFDQRMLLVDDSTIALNIEKTMFERMGFKVDTAISGRDALEKVALNTYDLMITDLEMPEMDGMALIQRLQDELHDKLFPIIMIATRDSDLRRQRALDVGAHAYVAKAQLKGDQSKLLKLLTNILHH